MSANVTITGAIVFDPAVAAQATLDSHTALTTDAHGGLLASSDPTVARLGAAQTWTAQQIHKVDVGGQATAWQMEVDKAALTVYRYNNRAGPEWATGLLVNSQGALHTNAWMVISGHMPATPDAEGYYYPRTASSEPSMLSIWGDVGGPSLEVRASNDPAAYLFSGLNIAGAHVFAIEQDGRLGWGTGDRAAMDVWLGRINGPGLELAGASSLNLKNNAAIAFKDSGGTYRNVLQLSTSNQLRLGANAGIVQTVVVGACTVRNFAETLNLLTILDNGRVGIGTQNYGGGSGVLVALANVTTPPTTNPAGGGVLYAEAGALKWRGSNGTITTIGAP